MPRGDQQALFARGLCARRSPSSPSCRPSVPPLHHGLLGTSFSIRLALPFRIAPFALHLVTSMAVLLLLGWRSRYGRVNLDIAVVLPVPAVACASVIRVIGAHAASLAQGAAAGDGAGARSAGGEVGRSCRLNLRNIRGCIVDVPKSPPRTLARAAFFQGLPGRVAAQKLLCARVRAALGSERARAACAR